MREIYKAGTPQQKLVNINNKFGNTDIKFQQGTTRCLYDTLPFTAAATGQSFRFFEDSASRTFPFTNTGSEGNKLGVGETMVIEEILFVLMTYDPDTNRWTSLSASFPQLNDAKYDIVLANNTVIKDFQTVAQLSAFNKQNSQASTWYQFDTDIVIPPLLNFSVNLRTSSGAAVPANSYLRCYILGTAGILAPRTTF